MNDDPSMELADATASAAQSSEAAAELLDRSADSDAFAAAADISVAASVDCVAAASISPEPAEKRATRRKRRLPRADAAEQRLRGRRAMCKQIPDIASQMLKTVKLRVLGRFIDSTRGLDDQALTDRILKEAHHIASAESIRAAVDAIDPDVHRRTLKELIVQTILLQEETYSLPENKLYEKVIEYEKRIVEQAQSLDFFDEKQHDPTRVHHCDTYRIVLEAAWRNNEDVSLDEAALLAVLRERLGISSEDHRLISAFIQRFPKQACATHTADEIHDARKALQRDGILWSYRDDEHDNTDVIPLEVATILRRDIYPLELQRTNFLRLLEHDNILLSDLRAILERHGMDRYGNKAELIARIAGSDIRPSRVLECLDRAKLSDMCRHVGITASGAKQELIERLVEFYDDLTFVERETLDEREEWYNNYTLLASRSHSDLRAKKLISKDLEIEHRFEQATEYLFENQLNLEIDVGRKTSKADGRILLTHPQVILWDCKSVEKEVNLQDFLEGQFDGYLRRERECGFEPLSIMVIGPMFTPQSIKLAHQYKARTNWDVALVTADALKHIADRWAATETDRPFPVGLFNRTDLIDMDRAEFLISLA